MSRSSLDVKHVRSGQHALTLAYDVAGIAGAFLTQHPLADLDLGELLSGLRSGTSKSCGSPVLILTRDARLDPLSEFLDGVGVQACCIDVAPEQIERALIELVGLAVRVDARVLVEMKVDLEEGPVQDVCRAVNISESGLLIRSSQPPPLGLEIAMCLHLDEGSEPVSVIGEVVRHTRPKERVQGAGLRLLRYEPGHRERLAAFIARERPRDNLPRGTRADLEPPVGGV